MPAVFHQPISPANISWDHDTPVADTYGDAYFTRHQGPAETHYVFIQGNQLEQRFQQLPSNGFFVVGETGFGTGLNFLATAHTFLQHAPKGARLHFVSTEKHPFSCADLQIAQAHWPELAYLATSLQAHFPESTPGFHRRWLANGRIALTLIYADVEEGLKQFVGKVDAWFLDGFAPAKNPAMWQPELFALLAQHSAPGATLATFTAAGFVRRGLLETGFAMRKRKGFGTKRDMLVGALSGRWQPQCRPLGVVAVAGAGLAGATCARTLAEQGWQVHVYDPAGIATKASGNAAGVLYATPSQLGTAQNLFYQHSYLHALYCLQRLGFPQTAEQGRLNGVYYELANPRQKEKITAALHSSLWPASMLQPVRSERVFLPLSGYLNPAQWCQHLLQHPNIQFAKQEIAPAHFNGERWHLALGSARYVVLANSFAAQQFASHTLPLRPQRGQVSYVAATKASQSLQQAWCHRGYLTPSMGGIHCMGATFARTHEQPEPRQEDDTRNSEELRDNLPEQWHSLGGDDMTIASSRVAYRCQTPDYVPIVGALGTNTFISVGHGSRGITHTPLSAELIAAQLSGEPWPTGKYIGTLLHPNRFNKT